MASVKVKFRPSTVTDVSGTLYYNVYHRGQKSIHSTAYRLYAEEWNAATSTIELSSAEPQRVEYLQRVAAAMEDDLHRFSHLVEYFEQREKPYRAADVVAAFCANTAMLMPFMRLTIERLREAGKIRTSETYASALQSFMRFRRGRDIAIEDIDAELIERYEAYLRDIGVCANSSSFYMRILRAAYNRAVDRGLAKQRLPFKHVYTGVAKTVKRALPLKTIRSIRDLDVGYKPSVEYARDMFLFSFYTRGMSFVDMAYLRKSNLHNGVLTYCRHKTGQQMFIRWEACMQDIVNKYYNPHSPYLLPIISTSSKRSARKQYIYAAHRVNANLKRVAEMLEIEMPLTMYVARHSWASVAHRKNIPLSVISEGMGHDSENTTRIYLTSLDNVAIDRANTLILSSL